MAAGLAGTLQAWKAKDDKPIRTITEHNAPIYRVLMCAPRGRMATLDSSGGFALRQNEGWLIRYQQLPVLAAYTMEWSPDGGEVAVGTQDSRLLLVPVPQ